MKYIIMAAGVGSRISRDINQIPKCSLHVKNNKSIIEIKIEKLLAAGNPPENIAVIIGYAASTVRSLVEKYQVNIYYNPFYRVTNSIASIWFAKDFIDGDFIAMNGDLYFVDSLLEELLEKQKNEFTMLCDSTRIKDADYRFAWSNNLLEKFGKDLPLEETTGEYVGIGMVTGQGVKKFLNTLEKMLAHEQYDCWWEDVIYRMVKEQSSPVHTLDIKGQFWGEVDYIEDYERIIDYVIAQNDK